MVHHFLWLLPCAYYGRLAWFVNLNNCPCIFYLSLCCGLYKRIAYLSGFPARGGPALGWEPSGQFYPTNTLAVLSPFLDPAEQKVMSNDVIAGRPLRRLSNPIALYTIIYHKKYEY
jgi:hypothetical protein